MMTAPLPPELLLHVLSHLAAHDLARTRLVNSAFDKSATALLASSATITQCGPTSTLPAAVATSLKHLDIIGHTCPPPSPSRRAPYTLPAQVIELLRIHWDHARWDFSASPPIFCPSVHALQPRALALRGCTPVLAGFPDAAPVVPPAFGSLQQYTFTLDSDESWPAGHGGALPDGHISNGVRWLLGLCEGLCEGQGQGRTPGPGLVRTTTLIFRSRPGELWGRQPQPGGQERVHATLSNWAICILFEMAKWVAAQADTHTHSADGEGSEKGGYMLTVVNAGVLREEIEMDGEDGEATVQERQDAAQRVVRALLEGIGGPTHQVVQRRLGAVEFLSMEDYVRSRAWAGIMEVVEAERWLGVGNK